MKKYYTFNIKRFLTVKDILTIEYLDIGKNFSHGEESHAFHEFVYVDSGNIYCVENSNKTFLEKNDFFLIPPNTSHRYLAAAPHSSVFIICFKVNSGALELLNGKTRLDSACTKILSDILRETKNAFAFPFDKKLHPLENPVIGAQQLVENYIEMLLIHLLRLKTQSDPSVFFVKDSTDFANNLVTDIIVLLKENVYGRISLDKICESTFYSKTYINKVFKKVTGFSIIRYFHNLKIDEAKKLLKTTALPVAAISDRLDYESPTYFTKSFRKATGMTPVAYKKSIK